MDVSHHTYVHTSSIGQKEMQEHPVGEAGSGGRGDDPTVDAGDRTLAHVPGHSWQRA
jgi:hypothetical protein